MVPTTELRPSPSYQAPLFIGVGTALWIGMPVIVALSPLSPLLLAALWQLAAAALVSAVLGFSYRDLALDARVRAAMWRGMHTPLFATIVLAEADFILFLWAAERSTPAVAAVLFEAWPLVVIAMGAWLFRIEHRYVGLRWATAPGAIAVLGGATAVVLSYEPLDHSLQKAALATVLGVSAAILGGTKLVCTVRLAANIAADARGSIDVGATARVEMAAALLLSAVSCVPLVGIALMKHDELRSASPEVLVLVLAFGAVLGGGARSCLRIGAVLTSNLDVTFLPSIAPAGSAALLLWLGLAGTVDGALLVAGAALVAAGNGWLRLTEFRRARRLRGSE